MKVLPVLFTTFAEQQIDDLHAYISSNSGEGRADRYVGRLVAFCEELRVFPHRGTKRDDVMAGLRTIGFERRVTIAFMITGDAVLIEGIFYGGREFGAQFKE